MTRWRKASRSGGEGGNCVEVASTLDRVRDSKNPTGPTLRGDIAVFVAAVKDGRLGS